MLTTCDQVTWDFNIRCKQCLIVSWPFVFHNANSPMQACTGQLLIYKAWFGVNKPGDRFDAVLDDCSDVIIVMEPLNSEVKQERVSLGRDVERVEKTNSKETGLCKQWQSETPSFDFSMGNSCTGHIRKHVCQACPRLIGMPVGVLAQSKCMLWVYVGMRAWPEGRVLVARICCLSLSILYSPHAHMKDRNNLFKNVPHPLSMLWLKWMRHVFAEKGWCEILSRVLCVVEGSLSSWSLS